jgi:hypothetical protein
MFYKIVFKKTKEQTIMEKLNKIIETAKKEGKEIKYLFLNVNDLISLIPDAPYGRINRYKGYYLLSFGDPHGQPYATYKPSMPSFATKIRDEIAGKDVEKIEMDVETYHQLIKEYNPNHKELCGVDYIFGIPIEIIESEKPTPDLLGKIKERLEDAIKRRSCYHEHHYIAEYSPTDGECYAYLECIRLIENMEKK